MLGKFTEPSISAELTPAQPDTVSFKDRIKNNPKLKNFVLRLLMPANQARPRTWVKIFVNPFLHTKGKGSRICSAVRMDVLPFNNFSLGSNSTIEDFSVVNNGVGDVVIGHDTRIGLSNVVIGPVQIGDNVMFAQNVVLSGLNHGYEDINTPPSLQKVTTSKITICDEVWIGANAVITAGVRIGKHSIIGAGSVVTKDVPDHCIAVGNPARVVKKYNFTTENWEKII